MVRLPDFRSHLKSGLLAKQFLFGYSKSGCVLISDLHRKGLSVKAESLKSFFEVNLKTELAFPVYHLVVETVIHHVLVNLKN